MKPATEKEFGAKRIRSAKSGSLSASAPYDWRIYRDVTLQLYGGVQNLFNAYQRDFDRGVERDSGYIYGPSLPRSWFVGAKISF